MSAASMPEPCTGRMFGNACVREADHVGCCYCPPAGRAWAPEPAAVVNAKAAYVGALSDRLRQGAADAHGHGLRTAGYNAALDDISIELAEEIERLVALESGGWHDVNVPGLRRAIVIVDEARP